jgi:SAM-dependent methyltransferase
VVLSSSKLHADVPSASAAQQTPAAVVWHDLECGAYRADLALWRELAERFDGPILDVGAGAGRVTLDLARAGHALTALDLDPLLLDALSGRARGLRVETVTADARSFALSRRDFALCVVPMQTIQLLGGAAGRLAFLRRARAHLRPGGALACAILAALEPFDASHSGIGPAAERAHVDGMVYLSRATRVSELEHSVVIERERWILHDRASAPGGAAVEDPGSEPAVERDVIELDRVAPAALEREAVQAGLRPEPAREVPATDEHVGSTVVMLRA